MHVYKPYAYFNILQKHTKTQLKMFLYTQTIRLLRMVCSLEGA